MKRIAFVLLLFFTSTLFAQQLDLESFVKHGDYLDMKLSPDGKHIAARLRTDGRVFLVILNTETMKMVDGVKPPNRDIIHSVQWISNERYVFEYAEKQSYYDQPIASDEKTGSRISHKDNTYATQDILSMLEGDDKYILIIEHPWTLKGNTYYDDRTKQPHISKLNVFSGNKKKLEVLPHPGASALATNDGKVVFMTWRDQEGTYHSAYRKDEDDEWQSLSSAFGIGDSLTAIRLSKDENFVLLSGRDGTPSVHTFFSLDINAGTVSRVFPEHSTDIEYYNRDANNMPAVGVTFPGKSEYVYATTQSKTRKVHKMLASAFEGQTVSIASRTQDGKTLLVHVRSDVNPGEYYLFDRDTLQANFLWANRSWIDPRTMAAMTPIKLNSSDGVELNGYLTLPSTNKSNNKPPLVVMIHGGPHQPGTRDYWEFNGEVQLLANRGYAVMQVNFRGSDGYGREFTRMG